MKISYVCEHNGNDTLIYSEDFIGAFTRGASLQEALGKMENEIISYCRWSNMKAPSTFDFECSLDFNSKLDIRDADSDIIFESEKKPLSADEYQRLKALALKSADDFLSLYNAIPDKNSSALAKRRTFYGNVPRTANEMYEHTKNINEYYFGEIGIDADNCGSICECRSRGFELLEKQTELLSNTVTVGSYGEEWSLKKVIRRFIWHDRIHAKAMYRMSKKSFMTDVPDLFCFEII